MFYENQNTLLEGGTTIEAGHVGVPITQVKELLGHASVATTQKYLDLSLDLDNTASDFVPLSGD